MGLFTQLALFGKPKRTRVPAAKRTVVQIVTFSFGGARSSRTKKHVGNVHQTTRKYTLSGSMWDRKAMRGRL
jgi:hypothetical protein